MILSLPDIMALCPPKLLKLYPDFIRQVSTRIDCRKAGWKNNKLPKAPGIIITGSRYGGKSQFAVRSCIGAILDGYIQSFMFCCITQDGAKDSMGLIDKVLEEAEEPIISSRDSDHPIRVLSNGEEIIVDYLNKVDAKARQTSAHILVLDEIEKWNTRQGTASLLTMLRHFDGYIVLSNDLPRWAKTIFETDKATFTRIDYWENPALEPSRLEQLNQMKVIDPEGWARDVMYLPTGGEYRVFTERQINNIFNERNPRFQPMRTILSIDPGAGGADNTAIFALDYDGSCVEARLLMDESIVDRELVQRVKRFRSEEGAYEEVWDYNGIGKAIMSFREEEDKWDLYGIVPFYGASINQQKYFNARAEAICLTSDLLNQGRLVVWGLNGEQQEELQREMRATTFDKDRETSGKTNARAVKITSKELIKKALGGQSPNMLDSITMGVWRLLTDLGTNRDVSIRYTTPNVSGVPSLD